MVDDSKDITSCLLHTVHNMDNFLTTTTNGIVTHNGRKVSLNLTRYILSLTDERNAVVVEIEVSDIIGAKHIVRPHNKSHIVEVYTYAHSYNNCFCFASSSKLRSRTCTILDFSNNEEESLKWKNAISEVARWREETRANFNPIRQRIFLIFVNPVSGTGSAVRIWSHYVKPMLDEAEIISHLIVTEYANHARNYVKDIDHSNIEAILIVGGDGLYYEVLNGILDRDDGLEILKYLPLFPIPGGSGNGLVKSILFASG
jgi:sphingosine kinase